MHQLSDGNSSLRNTNNFSHNGQLTLILLLLMLMLLLLVLLFNIEEFAAAAAVVVDWILSKHYCY